jgi:hypothetical protein
VLASPEAHVRRGVRPAENELIGSVKNLRITVSGCIAQRDWLSWLDSLAMELHIHGCRARKASIWAV